MSSGREGREGGARAEVLAWKSGPPPAGSPARGSKVGSDGRVHPQPSAGLAGEARGPSKGVSGRLGLGWRWIIRYESFFQGSYWSRGSVHKWLSPFSQPWVAIHPKYEWWVYHREPCG